MKKVSLISAPLVASAVSLVVGLGLLAVMLWKAEFLVRLGLVGHLWYVLLLVVGLAVAVCVFSLFRSYARYHGKVLNGTLEIGGPAVLMLVVIALGFYLVPMPPTKFDLTIFVHGDEGRQSLVLRNNGVLVLDFGADRRREKIADKGEARFVGIPADQRGRRVPAALEADGYELVDRNARVALDTESAYLAIRAKLLAISGQVFDSNGNILPGASVTLPQYAATTDANGRFTLTVPSDLAESERTLTITAAAHQPYIGRVTPGGNPLTVRLDAAK